MNTTKTMNRALASFGLLLCGTQASDAMNFNSPTSASIESAQMGGASMAFAQSSKIASDNPAGMADLGNRIDGGL